MIESQGITEKSKNRLDLTSEELERVLLQKEGESLKDNSVQVRQGGVGGKRVIGKAVAKGGLLLKGKNPGNVCFVFFLHFLQAYPKQIQRQEDDIRTRMSTASDAFRKAVTDTQAMRQEYYNFQLPRILRVGLSITLPTLRSPRPGFEGMRRRNRPRYSVPPYSVCVFV